MLFNLNNKSFNSSLIELPWWVEEFNAHPFYGLHWFYIALIKK